VTAAAPTRDQVFDLLDLVRDPEVPVLSVVELGIIRDVRVDDAERVTVVVTPTYSGCPAMHTIEADITRALREHGFREVTVETVFQPAWTTDWIAPAARAKLEAYGIAPPGPRERGDELVPLLRRAEPVRCPYCKSRETELRSEFGSTACKSILFCRACNQPFEQFKAI
jgi:ring-1,2-phenylacetyl-CoA epoxidase subunit PaaD